MSNMNEDLHTQFFGKQLYMFLSLIIAVPIFLAINYYLNTIQVHNDEAVSVAATAFFMAGIFAGRYVAQLWTSRLKLMPYRLVTALALLIVACTTWLFVHADFPLQGRVAINLLLFWIPFAMISVALGILIKVIRAITENQLKDAQVSAATSKSELHLLQSQLSPHFLFNTLNNLYGLSITQHEKLPVLLLKLSELLRYSVYDANEMFVPLKDEMAYINNYIDFEKLRIGDRLVLTTDLEHITNTEIKIAPMLLIVFIENAFKHSKNTADQQIFIEIGLKTWGNSILFSIKNSYSKPKEPETVIDKSSGFGLTSVSKRLELLYHLAHEMSVLNDDKHYKVMLQLKMKQHEHH
ncbi:MAG: histidine kinase [Chitinophagaceae bacterium]